MSTSIVNQAEIELLDYVPKNESNKQTVDKINELLKLIQEHLCTLENSTHITRICFTENARLFKLDERFSRGFQKIKFEFCAFGPSKEFTLAEVATLLKMTNTESETAILNELKTLVGNQMIFYESFLDCTTTLTLAWNEFLREFGGDFKNGDWSIRRVSGIPTTDLKNYNFNSVKFRHLWLDWSKVATAFLKYLFNVCKYSGNN
jgi:hypothetical protein